MLKKVPVITRAWIFLQKCSPLGVPQEAHAVRVGRCASDMWLWARWALRVVQWSVVTLHVALWSLVALRDGLLAFMQLAVFRLHVVFKMGFFKVERCVMLWWLTSWFSMSCATIARCALRCGE